MSENQLEKYEMCSVEFCQSALRDSIAPPSLGSVKARITKAARRLRWSVNRTKSVWYADPRISISADEMRQVEEATGIEYGRHELRTNEDLIAKAEALLQGADPDFYRSFLVAMVAFAGLGNRAGTGER